LHVGLYGRELRHLISIRQTEGLYWVPGHAGVGGNKIADKLARGGSIQKFTGPEPSLGAFSQNIKNRIKAWVLNQHLVM
jgi:ribonuclease HI